MFLKWLQEKKESNVLKKHISCECKCKFDSRKCKSDQKWNNDKLENVIYLKKIVIGVLLNIVAKMVNI